MVQVLAFILQVQCGFQTIGSATISYGNVVFVTADDRNKPQVAFFQTSENPGKPHPYCEPLQRSLSSGQAVALEIDRANNQVVQLQVILKP
ncbi:MAG TPA: hypothetical protein VF412_16730 [Bdellovibrio sp.]|uniref:hypothetical protein n=1 Tax=Bdellovibrio sp. TaxID=28201 RepID=UPI002F09C48E